MSDSRIAANDWKRTGLTASVVIRRGIFAVVALVSIAALALAALPLVASTQLVRNRIAIELSAWSGFRVAIASTPQIEIWPTFKTVLSGVTLYQWGDWDNPAVIEAERVEIDLSAIEALSGNVSFTEAKVVNPVVRIGPETIQPGPDSIGSSGRIAQAVDQVRSLVSANPDAPDFSRFPMTPVGSVEIQNGRVVMMVAGEQRDVVTRLGGRVEWPALNASGRATFSGVWRGEQVKVDLSSDSPLSLFAGGASGVMAQWQSGPVNAKIEGTVRTADDGSMKMHVDFATPSVRRAVAWTGIGLSTGSALGSIAITGDVAGDRRRLAMDNASVTIDEDAATGSLALQPLVRPVLSGELVFQHIDLPSLVGAFTPLMSYDRAPNDTAPALADLIDAHLAFKATTAALGGITAEALGGLADIDRQTTTFTLTQANAFGGSVTGALKLDEALDRRTTSIEFAGTGIDGPSLAEAIDLTQLVPTARGDVSLQITGRGHALDAVLGSASGSISARFGPGELKGIDLSRLIAKTSGGGFFPLAEISQGILAIDAAELDATVSDGVGRIQKALVTSGQKAISLSGIMPYAGRGVALSGAITSQDKITLLNPFGREATFFVGGSWDAPFVSAALPSQLPQ